MLSTQELAERRVFSLDRGIHLFFLRRLVLVLCADVSLTGKGSGGGSSVMVSL